MPTSRVLQLSSSWETRQAHHSKTVSRLSLKHKEIWSNQKKCFASEALQMPRNALTGFQLKAWLVWKLMETTSLWCSYLARLTSSLRLTGSKMDSNKSWRASMAIRACRFSWTSALRKHSWVSFVTSSNLEKISILTVRQSSQSKKVSNILSAKLKRTASCNVSSRQRGRLKRVKCSIHIFTTRSSLELARSAQSS